MSSSSRRPATTAATPEHFQRATAESSEFPLPIRTTPLPPGATMALLFSWPLPAWESPPLIRALLYVTWDGTSASAAIIAGSAALMRAVHSTLTNGVVVERLASTADAAGTQDQTGNGRVNLARAISDTSTTSIEPSGSAPVGN